MTFPPGLVVLSNSAVDSVIGGVNYPTSCAGYSGGWDVVILLTLSLFTAMKPGLILLVLIAFCSPCLQTLRAFFYKTRVHRVEINSQALKPISIADAVTQLGVLVLIFLTISSNDSCNYIKDYKSFLYDDDLK